MWIRASIFARVRVRRGGASRYSTVEERIYYALFLLGGEHAGIDWPEELIRDEDRD